MPDDLNRWEKVKRLGEGGQGQVFLVRTPDRAEARKQAMAQIRPCIGNIRGYEGESSDAVVQKLLHAIAEYNRPEKWNELGALKEFKIPTDDKEEEAKAVGRLKSEVRALENVRHNAVLRLLHSNVAERFIVTEYHHHGTLAQNLHRYKGNPSAALDAFRGLVDGVHEIHGQGAIHRDIKPENIFVADSGLLMLGDFGIVFFQDGGRMTMTYERVGSHFWMAPWAYDSVRLNFDKVSPTLDIYPLGKVLWSMISGRNGFPFWEYAEGDNDLEKLFPDDSSMPLVNGLLGKCVVRYEKDCRLSTASDLLSEVDAISEKIKANRRYRSVGAQTWPCRVCGKGNYQNGALSHQVKGYRDGGPWDLKNIVLDVYVCDYCSHAELFAKYPDKASSGSVP